MREDHLLHDARDSVVRITMSRVDRRNAMTLETIKGMTAFFERRKPAFSGR